MSSASDPRLRRLMAAKMREREEDVDDRDRYLVFVAKLFYNSLCLFVRPCITVRNVNVKL